MNPKELQNKLQKIKDSYLESKEYEVNRETLENLISEYNILAQKGSENKELMRKCYFLAMSLRKIYRTLHDPEFDTEIVKPD